MIYQPLFDRTIEYAIDRASVAFTMWSYEAGMPVYKLFVKECLEVMYGA
jgi:hypothetical protein